MATTGSDQSFPPGAGMSGWDTASSELDPDRRPASRRRDMKGLVRDTTYQRLGVEKNRASDAMESLAGAIRSLTQQLGDDGQTALANYVTKAADGIERWASTLRQQDLEDVVRRLEDFARRRPAVFLGVAFTTGVLAARFLKSSSHGRVPPLAGGVL